MIQRQKFTILVFGLLLLTACAPRSALSEPRASSATPTSTTTLPTPTIVLAETVGSPTMTPVPATEPPLTITPTVVPGAQGNNHSYHTHLSADGRFIVFESLASNLVAGDTNGVSDIFVHDRQTGTTKRVSVASDGTEANGASAQSNISSDGRWVVFTSEARNLVPDDTNRVADIFVYDRQMGTTERVSVASGSTQGNGPSYEPSISADGRYVAFVSAASDLVPDDTNERNEVFVHDRQTGQTERVSVSSGGTQANDWSDWPGISADGRFVAFGSSATNLTADAKGGVFVHDRKSSTTEWLSEGFAPSISGDGRWVAFLATDAADGWIFLFAYDRQTDTMVRIRRIVEGIHGKPGKEISISDDGHWIAFWAVESDLATGAQKAYTDVFVYDSQTGTTELVSIASDGTPGDSGSGTPGISADGRFVVFDSNATNLVSDDTNEAADIFVHDRLTGKTERVSVASSLRATPALELLTVAATVAPTATHTPPLAAPTKTQIPRHIVEPLVTAKRLRFDNWSLDGKWIAYWHGESDDRPAHLAFVDAHSKEICRHEELTSGFWNGYAIWQDDGRVLAVLNQNKDVFSGTPCGVFDPLEDYALPGDGDDVSPDGRYRAETTSESEGQLIHNVTTIIDMTTSKTVANISWDASVQFLRSGPWWLAPPGPPNFGGVGGVYLIGQTLNQGVLYIAVPDGRAGSVLSDLFGSGAPYGENLWHVFSHTDPVAGTYHILLQWDGGPLPSPLLLYHSELDQVEELSFYETHPFQATGDEPLDFFSPGGTWLLVSDPINTERPPEAVGEDYWLQPVDPPGSEAVKIAERLAAGKTSWEAQKMAFYDRKSIYVIRIPGGEWLGRWVASSHALVPEGWSPDGKRLAAMGFPLNENQDALFIIEP